MPRVLPLNTASQSSSAAGFDFGQRLILDGEIAALDQHGRDPAANRVLGPLAKRGPEGIGGDVVHKDEFPRRVPGKLGRLRTCRDTEPKRGERNQCTGPGGSPQGFPPGKSHARLGGLGGQYLSGRGQNYWRLCDSSHRGNNVTNNLVVRSPQMAVHPVVVPAQAYSPNLADCNLVAWLRIQKLGNFEFAVFQHGLAVAE